jgi:hypothetical protein
MTAKHLSLTSPRPCLRTTGVCVRPAFKDARLATPPKALGRPASASRLRGPTAS